MNGIYPTAECLTDAPVVDMIPRGPLIDIQGIRVVPLGSSVGPSINLGPNCRLKVIKLIGTSNR